MRYNLEGFFIGLLAGILFSIKLLFSGIPRDRSLGILLVFLTAIIFWAITAIIELWKREKKIPNIRISESTIGFMAGFVGPFIALAYCYTQGIKGLIPIALYMLLTLLSLVGFLTGIYIENKKKRTPSKENKIL